MPHDLDNQFYLKQTKDMVNLVQRLVADGKFLVHVFTTIILIVCICYGLKYFNLQNLVFELHNFGL